MTQAIATAPGSGRLPRTHWREEAMCGLGKADLFFPGAGRTRKRPGGGIQPQDYCAVCPVLLECLFTALTATGPEGDVGVFGGMTSNERRRLRRELRKAYGDDYTMADLKAFLDQRGTPSAASLKRAPGVVH